MLSHIDLFETVIKRFQCQACGNYMSAKNSNYNHAAQFPKRVQEVDKPKAIPVPKNMLPNLKNILPVKWL